MGRELKFGKTARSSQELSKKGKNAATASFTRMMDLSTRGNSFKTDLKGKENSLMQTNLFTMDNEKII